MLEGSLDNRMDSRGSESMLGKVYDFLPVGVFLMGGYLAIYGLTNQNKMIKAGEWLPLTGIITMHLAMEKME